MATCTNCGETQSDFLSTHDIEALQLELILTKSKLESVEGENASLKAMLKTQADVFQIRLRGIVEDSTAEAETLRMNISFMAAEINELKAQLADAAKAHPEESNANSNVDPTDYASSFASSATSVKTASTFGTVQTAEEENHIATPEPMDESVAPPPFSEAIISQSPIPSPIPINKIRMSITGRPQTPNVPEFEDSDDEVIEVPMTIHGHPQPPNVPEFEDSDSDDDDVVVLDFSSDMKEYVY